MLCAGEKVPTLEEVVEQFAPRSHIHLVRVLGLSSALADEHRDKLCGDCLLLAMKYQSCTRGHEVWAYSPCISQQCSRMLLAAPLCSHSLSTHQQLNLHAILCAIAQE